MSNLKTTDDDRHLLRKRRRLLLGGSALAAIAAFAGWGAASLTTSPAEIAARTAAPAPDLITAQVTSEVFNSSIVTRGSSVAVGTVDVDAHRPAGVDAAIATRLPIQVGQSLKPGALLLEVSGRPLFLLPGKLPPYRDLHEGDTGADVTQLQSALAAAGHSTSSDNRGRFGPGTAFALRALYTAAGYESSGQLPTNEVVYVAAKRIVVAAAPSAVGAIVGKRAISLSTGDVQVVASIARDQQSLVRSGMKVDLYSEVADQHYSGQVGGFIDTAPPGVPAATSVDARYLTIDIQGSKAPEAGDDVRVTFSSGHSAGTVLVVPQSAIYATGSGVTTVKVLEADGTQRPAPVKVGATADGQAEVAPVDDGVLKAGDRVVVGQR